jgi:hypothetical protein
MTYCLNDVHSNVWRYYSGMYSASDTINKKQKERNSIL